MTSTKIPSLPASGYWTVQVVKRDQDQIGPRYLCRASDDLQARSIAGHLAGSSTAIVGYDYHRIDPDQERRAPALEIGQSVSIDSPDVWASLQPTGGTA